MFRSIAVAVCVLALPTVANAHLYWIEPNEFFFFAKTKAMDDKVSEKLSIESSGGDTYFNPDVNRLQDERAYRIEYRSPTGKVLAIKESFNGLSRHIDETALVEKGTYTLAISRTQSPMYYSKLANGQWVTKAKDELSDEEKQGGQVFGGYFQHMKSYVTLHTPTDAWKNPVGHTLELVPLSHPNLVTTGKSLKVQLLAHGKPLANTKIVGIYQGYRAKKHGETPLMAKTDAQGVATLKFPRSARWLLSAKHEEPQANNPKADLFEHQASLMLEVNEPWVFEWLEK